MIKIFRPLNKHPDLTIIIKSQNSGTFFKLASIKKVMTIL